MGCKPGMQRLLTVNDGKFRWTWVIWRYRGGLGGPALGLGETLLTPTPQAKETGVQEQGVPRPVVSFLLLNNGHVIRIAVGCCYTVLMILSGEVRRCEIWRSVTRFWRYAWSL